MSARLTMLEKMIERGSSDPFVHYARAMELRSLGRGEEALTAFESVIARFPEYVPTYLMAGQLAAELHAFECARSCFTRGLSAAAQAGDEHAKSELASALAGLPEPD